MALQENMETPYTPKVWDKVTNTKWAQKLVCICILFVLLSSTVASLLQTGFGAVQVTRFTIPTQGGSWVAGRLYMPSNASSTNKIPIVITQHGVLNDNNMQDIHAIELSRRGIAVIAYDGYAHGDSSMAANVERTVTTASGMVPLVEFVWNLDWVDRTKIGVMGHSAGGGSAWTTLTYYGKLYTAAYNAAIAATSEGGTTITAAEQATITAADKIWAGFPFSNGPGTSANWNFMHANVGINLGYFDEGGDGYRGRDYSGTDSTVTGKSIPAGASLSFINGGLPANQKITSVVIGRYYGSAADKTLRVVYNPRQIHAWGHFSTQTAQYVVTFFQTAFQVTSPIPATSQVWLAKEILNCVGLAMALLIIVPIAVLLLKLPVFASLNKPVPQQLPALTNVKSRLIFWGIWMSTWLIAFLTYLPIGKMGDTLFGDSKLIKGALLHQIFPQVVTNYFLIWAPFIAIISLAIFCTWYFLWGKKHGVTTAMMGLKIGLKDLLKTILLAATVVFGVYLLLMASEYFFGTDFRIWTFALTLFKANVFLVLLRYLPFFFLFYAMNSLYINGGMRVARMKEWFNILVLALSNSLGMILLLVAQYWSELSPLHLRWNSEWLMILVLVPMVPLMFISTYISRYLFKATGRIWLGALVNTVIILAVGVGNTQTPYGF